MAKKEAFCCAAPVRGGWQVEHLISVDQTDLMVGATAAYLVEGPLDVGGVGRVRSSGQGPLAVPASLYTDTRLLERWLPAGSDDDGTLRAGSCAKAERPEPACG